MLFLLAAGGLLAALTLPFLTHAPNRLLSGRAISLGVVLGGVRDLALLPGLVLLAGPFLPQRRWMHAVLVLAAAVFLLGLLWLAGAGAAVLAAGAPPIARTSFGSGFWVLFLVTALALIDAERRLGLSRDARLLGALLLIALAALLALNGAFDQLSLAREYRDHRQAFADALVRHVLMVAAALVPALLIGVPLGVWAQRRQGAGRVLFPTFNLVQTIPSIALFGFLIAPLAALAALLPGLARLGIGGIGMAPAVIALVLYALLPIVRNTAAGLEAVPGAALEAARAIGMAPLQIFWRISLPLALPVFLSGLRIALVQAVGLAAVAALIGAGGLGALMFQGLFADALDLVLLGAVPVIGLALAADVLLKVAADHARRVPA